MVKFTRVKEEVRLSDLDIGDTFMFEGRAYLVINSEFGNDYEVMSYDGDDVTFPYRNDLICVTDFTGETNCFPNDTIVTPVNIISTIEE